MTYSVKEIFYTLQGEGIRAGRPSVFCRFSGCNLWSGREEDRDQAICNFCDTDFVGTDGTQGGKFPTASQLASAVASMWPKGKSNRYVVLTGGEPLLQVDQALIEALHKQDFEIAVETNGTVLAPHGIDWICVSPKAGAEWIQRTGNELKLIYPQALLMPSMIKTEGFDHYLLQPMDPVDKTLGGHGAIQNAQRTNTERAIDYCQQNPEWRLSVQTHKILEIR
jgi:7-carboxy-7-deazaguanine synthase (Cx14CxxC type)